MAEAKQNESEQNNASHGTAGHGGSTHCSAPRLSARSRRFTRARTATFLVVVALVCMGLATNAGIGTPSAFGIDWVSVVCPLGSLEALLAGHHPTLRLLVWLAIAMVAILVFGKAFCSWACPVPWIRRAISPKTELRNEADERALAAQQALDRWKNHTTAPKRRTFDTRHAVLAGALAASFAFGFPVFCLVCPVGLTFGEVVLLWRLVQYNQWTWAIVLFPAIIVLEIVVLRRWCGRICPIGALLSLIARGNHTLRPTVDERACLKLNGGMACDNCARACPEEIDVATGLGNRAMNECVKCGRCAEACPAQAIAFKLLAKSDAAKEPNEAPGSSEE